MTLPRDISELALDILRDGVNPFDPASLKQVGDDPRHAQLCAALEKCCASADGPQVAALLLQVLRVAEEDFVSPAPPHELVVTVPPGLACSARRTAPVLREMLAGAAREIIALGYEISEPGFITELRLAAQRGVRVTLICSRDRRSGKDIAEHWHSNVPLPRIFEDLEGMSDTPHGTMHGKALLVDGEDLLVSSANFTFHGLKGNLEFGIRIRGQAAEDARSVVQQLMDSDALCEHRP